MEAANGLMIQGMEVTVVHIADVLMNQQLDKPASDLMLHELEAKGLNFLMSHETAAIEGKNGLKKSSLKMAQKSILT